MSEYLYAVPHDQGDHGGIGGREVSDRRRLEDELEEAWVNGEISHADACAILAEAEGER